MRLTISDKQAFVRAVLDDVPSIDYSAEFRVFALDASAKKLPKAIKAIHDDPKLRGWLQCDKWANMPGSCCRVYDTDFEDDKYRSKVEELSASNKAQNAQRSELHNKLTAAIASCTTLKQAQALLPEFAKYLPEDRESVTKCLPAVANLVADLSRAGWPKGVAK